MKIEDGEFFLLLELSSMRCEKMSWVPTPEGHQEEDQGEDEEDPRLIDHG